MPAFPIGSQSDSKCRQLRQAYRDFFRTDDGRTFAHSFGRSISKNYIPYRRSGNGEAEIDFCDPVDLPRSSVLDHPIDHIEPAGDFQPLAWLTVEQIREVTAIFEFSLRWCLEIAGLVDKGRRLAIVISIMRPDLSVGLIIDKKEKRIFKRANGGVNGGFELTGRAFGPILEWLRRGERVSELGERILILVYILRPDLIGDQTLEELGRISNKTRQAKDKLANCLRDTYSGIKARAMRGDITRIRCRNSH
jgi:hypothetical protein